MASVSGFPWRSFLRIKKKKKKKPRIVSRVPSDEPGSVVDARSSMTNETWRKAKGKPLDEKQSDTRPFGNRGVDSEAAKQSAK